MIGFPKHLNTKQDYLNCIGPYPAQTKVALQLLIDSRFVWESIGILRADEEGINDGEQYKIIDIPDENGVISRHQYAFVEDRNASIFRLGYTAGDVEELIMGIE